MGSWFPEPLGLCWSGVFGEWDSGETCRARLGGSAGLGKAP